MSRFSANPAQKAKKAKIQKISSSSRNVRPTSGKVLLALFNILGSTGQIEGCRFLDLFAGTGEISMTALERGASFALAVESDRAMASGISSRFASLGPEEPPRARLLCADVRRALPKLARECSAEPARKFDVVFADPPYSLGWGDTLPGLMEESISILSKEGVFVFEHSIRETPAESGSRIFVRDDRIYGDTVLSFYRLTAERTDKADSAGRRDVF